MKNILFKKENQTGIAALPVIMVLGMLTLAIAVGVTSVAFSELMISQGSSQSTRALSYAEAGARDALWKISHNKNYSCVSTDCYTIDFVTNGCSAGTGCAKVSVSSAAGDTANPKVITSKGVVGVNSRTIQVNLVLDSGTNDGTLQYGLITSTTWSELTGVAPTQTTPTFNPSSGAITFGSTVAISSNGADSIYYTTDGSDPTVSSTLYTTPVTISSAVTLKAIAIKSGYTNSAIGSAGYTQATSIPTVTTPTQASVAQTTVTLGANVTSLGIPASISARGVCYGTSPAPTTNCTPASGTTTGVFTQSITGLTAGTLYYYRGYATNATGTGYSADDSFTTTASNVAPTVTSPTSTSVADTTVTLGANVTSLGVPASISARGVCYGTSATPRGNCTPEGGTTTGVFTQSITSLTAGTVYYYAGYATNTTGTTYTSDGTFTTTSSGVVPTVTTPTATFYCASTYTLGANVTSLGTPASISARGTCFGTSPAPTTNCAAEGGTSTGVFTHNRTPFSTSTTYYYRGYATNATGTAYSSDGTFTYGSRPGTTCP